MTFLNWSDPEELIGLLTEYVTDEKNQSEGDPARGKFLSDLSGRLNEFDRHFETGSVDEAIAKLRGIRKSIIPEFSDDPVVEHVDACLEELERVKAEEEG